MKRLIDAIINKWFCTHVWKRTDELSYYKKGESSATNNLPVGIKTVYACEKCGKWKEIKTGVA